MFGLFGKRRRPTGRDLRAQITDIEYAVIDTELTGLDERKDAIVSLGAVHMEGGRIELGEVFYRLVSPHAELTAENVCIHEITPTEVESKPAIDTVLADFLSFCGKRVLVGHFVAIDTAFLERDAERLAGRKPDNPVVDTFSIYQWLCKRHRVHPCLEAAGLSTRLYDIAKCFGIPVNCAHNALMDAYTTAQLFQRFIPLLLEAGARDLDDLLSLGSPFKGGEGQRQTGEIGSL